MYFDRYKPSELADKLLKKKKHCCSMGTRGSRWEEIQERNRATRETRGRVAPNRKGRGALRTGYIPQASSGIVCVNSAKIRQQKRRTLVAKTTRQERAPLAQFVRKRWPEGSSIISISGQRQWEMKGSCEKKEDRTRCVRDYCPKGRNRDVLARHSHGHIHPRKTGFFVTRFGEQYNQWKKYVSCTYDKMLSLLFDNYDRWVIIIYRHIEMFIGISNCLLKYWNFHWYIEVSKDAMFIDELLFCLSFFKKKLYSKTFAFIELEGNENEEVFLTRWRCIRRVKPNYSECSYE